MNISIIFIVAIGLCSFINGSEHKVQGNSSNIVITLNVQSPEATQESASIVPTEDGFFKKIQRYSWQDSMATQWKKYRGSLFLISVVSLYGYLWHQLNQAHKLLDNTEVWSCWKNHIAVDHLTAYSRDELSKELFIDIQERYINSEDPTNHLLPFSAFLPMVEKERALLEKYVWWGPKIIACRMKLLFPVSKESIDQAAESIRRLKFIKALFISWWAVQNSNNSMPIRL